MSPAVLNETVKSVKLYLDEQIKISGWTTLQQLLRSLFNEKRGFEVAKKLGVGEGIIKRFLGDNWSLRRIQEALASLHEDEQRKGI